MPLFAASDLARWTGGRWTQPPARALAGIGTDTRGDLRGRLFVALSGARHDGHDHVAAAFVAGAGAAVVAESRLGTCPLNGPLLVVSDTRRALADLASGHRARLDARFVGITGSAGKTTVKEMTADLLQGAGLTARTRGNWNNDIGLPLSLLEMEADARFGVFELGTNHPGELAPLARILRHQVGLVTTVGVAHAEHFADVAAIAREKGEVLRAVPADGLVVVGARDPYREILCDGVRARVVTVALEGAADYQVRRRPGGQFEVEESATGERAVFSLGLPGAFLVYDAALAVAVARHFGLSWDALVATLAGFRPGKMRGQESHIAGVIFINDAYNANPLSMRAALHALAERATAGSRWLVLGGMGELGACAEIEHRAVGAEAARCGFEGLVAVGPRAAGFIAGAEAAGFPGALVCAADPAEAAAVLRRHVRPGDLVLLKGSRSERIEDVLPAFAAAGGSGE